MSGKVNLGIWEKLTRLVIFLLVIAGLMAIALWYLPLFQQNEQMRKDILHLENQIALEEKKAEQLKSAITALQRDPRAVERLAREKLGFAKPGETVVRFESNDSGSSFQSAGN